MTDDEKKAYEAQDREDSLNRRDFLMLLGTAFAAMTTAGCKLRPPKEKIIPYLQQPEQEAAGLARWYASTCGGCSAACGALVKSRDGRPIKMEGNPDHPLSRGGLCARGQATLLDLYDGERLRHPLAGDGETTWAKLDAAVGAGLAAAAAEGKQIRLLTQTLPSPSLEAAIDAFSKRFPAAKRVVYDSTSAAAILEAHRRTHGRAALPHYAFEKARVIVSFDADFLGSWISPVEFAKSWSANRRPESDGWDLMSWHAQFEPRMSVTGASADLRAPLRPSQQAAAVVELGRVIARAIGWKGPLPKAAADAGLDDDLLRQTAQMLLGARERSLVVSGSDDLNVQLAVNWINEMLGNYGHTLDLSRPSLQKAGEDRGLAGLLEDMENGRVGALLILGANPAYDNPLAARFAAALPKVPLTVALSERRDETASLCSYTAAASHFLESWGDAEPVAGVVSLTQPLVSPLFDTRAPLESLLAWSGKPESAYDFVKERWRGSVFPRQSELSSFTAFWDEALRRGAFALESGKGRAAAFSGASVASVRAGRPATLQAGSLELAPYAGISMSDGRQANNPWLQELPDPITKVCWGNVACFAPGDAKRLGLAEGRLVRLSAEGRSVQLPAYIQPGQAEGVVAVALGYGRTKAGPIAANFPTVKLLPIDREPVGGGDVFPLVGSALVGVDLLHGQVKLAKTQLYDSQTVPLTGQTRDALRETTLQDFYRRPPESELGQSEPELWPRHDYPGHKWGMVVNLTSCTGCSACVIACQAENNVPVVGRAEVEKSREMHWIRIDRYFSEGADGVTTAAFQPMLCQQCDNAPCETVCPVLATTHSSEGLNMQVYNRCVGTRYCANNCPYKVRRFNWFDYAHQDLLQNMALNPDVTVRSRGVMEKCSFCVQRIYSAKFQAKADGRELKDGDVTPACAQSCPADAIVFGDLNDPESRVSRQAQENGRYRALSELGVGPSVIYGVKVRNRRT